MSRAEALLKVTSAGAYDRPGTRFPSLDTLRALAEPHLQRLRGFCLHAEHPENHNRDRCSG